jgi:hypothetical protein
MLLTDDLYLSYERIFTKEDEKQRYMPLLVHEYITLSLPLA